MLRSNRILVAFLSLALLAAACSGSDGESPSPFEDVTLAKSTAKPLEFVNIDGLPEDVDPGNLYAKVHPGDDVGELNGSFPAVVYPKSASNFVLAAPFLGSTDAGTVEVVVTNGEHKSSRQTLNIEAMETQKGAFADAVKSLDRTMKTIVEKSSLSESELKSRLRQDEAIERKFLPLALAYHLISDPKNPKALTNREFDQETRKLLDAFAARSNLAELAEAAHDNLAAPDMALGGQPSKEAPGFQPVGIDNARQLSFFMNKYRELSESMESLKRAKKVFSIYAMIAGLPLGVAEGVVAAILGEVFSVLGTTASVAEYMEGTRLGQLPCCFKKVGATLANGGAELEDERAPQVQVTGYDTVARSEGMNFSETTKKFLLSILQNILSKIRGAGIEGTEAYDKAISEEAVEQIIDQIKSDAVSKALNEYAERTSDGAIVYTWEVTLHGPRDRETDADGDEWLAGERVGAATRRMLNLKSPTRWRLRGENNGAYEAGTGRVRIYPKPGKFKGKKGKHPPAATKVVELKPISIQFNPTVKTVERGQTYEFEVVVRHSTSPKIADIFALAGKVTSPAEQVNKTETSATYKFTWKSPKDRNQYPVQLKTWSESKKGLRSYAAKPPDHTAHMTIYNGEYVAIPGIPCVRTGKTHTIRAAVSPKDATLDWSTDVGSLEVADDTHSAVFHAPGSPAEGKVRVKHRNPEDDEDPDIKDASKVVVRDHCMCTYQVSAGGHINDFGRKPDNGTFRATLDETDGSMAFDYQEGAQLGSMKSMTFGAPAETIPLPTDGTDEFSTLFSYTDGQRVRATVPARAGTIEVKWVKAHMAKITVKGLAMIDPNYPFGAGKRNYVAQFEATLWPEIWRKDESGTQYGNCEGEPVGSGGSGLLGVREF